MKATITFLAILFTAVALCCIASAKAFGQEVIREGKNFTQVQTVQKASDTKTVFTYTIRDTVYPIWITKNGRCYIVRTSKNGNEYRQYLPENVSREIAAELGVTYVETKKAGE